MLIALLENDTFTMRKTSLTEFFESFGFKKTSKMLTAITDVFSQLDSLISWKAKSDKTTFEETWFGVPLLSYQGDRVILDDDGDPEPDEAGMPKKISKNSLSERLGGFYGKNTILRAVNWLVKQGFLRCRWSNLARSYEYAIGKNRFLEEFTAFKGNCEFPKGNCEFPKGNCEFPKGNCEFPKGNYIYIDPSLDSSLDPSNTLPPPPQQAEREEKIEIRSEPEQPQPEPSPPSTPFVESPVKPQTPSQDKFSPAAVVQKFFSDPMRDRFENAPVPGWRNSRRPNDWNEGFLEYLQRWHERAFQKPWTRADAIAYISKREKRNSQHCDLEALEARLQEYNEELAKREENKALLANLGANQPAIAAVSHEEKVEIPTNVAGAAAYRPYQASEAEDEDERAKVQAMVDARRSLGLDLSPVLRKKAEELGIDLSYWGGERIITEPKPEPKSQAFQPEPERKLPQQSQQSQQSSPRTSGGFSAIGTSLLNIAENWGLVVPRQTTSEQFEELIEWPEREIPDDVIARLSEEEHEDYD